MGRWTWIATRHPLHTHTPHPQALDSRRHGHAQVNVNTDIRTCRTCPSPGPCKIPSALAALPPQTNGVLQRRINFCLRRDASVEGHSLPCSYASSPPCTILPCFNNFCLRRDASVEGHSGLSNASEAPCVCAPGSYRNSYRKPGL